MFSDNEIDWFVLSLSKLNTAAGRIPGTPLLPSLCRRHSARGRSRSNLAIVHGNTTDPERTKEESSPRDDGRRRGCWQVKRALVEQDRAQERGRK